MFGNRASGFAHSWLLCDATTFHIRFLGYFLCSAYSETPERKKLTISPLTRST